MLCDHLEGWDREGGREGDARGKRGNIRICITDSLCYKAETNTPLYSSYAPIKVLKKKLVCYISHLYFCHVYNYKAMIYFNFPGNYSNKDV